MKVKRMRCCMCPNVNQAETVCPGIPERTPPDPSNCYFVKTFIDKRGWIYKVDFSIETDAFRARYLKPGNSSWRCHRQMPWRKTFDEAQEDLNQYANKKAWMVYEY